MCLWITLTALSIVLLSFASVAIAHTDIALFYSACGADLWSFVFLDTVVGAVFLVAGALFSWAGGAGVRAGIALSVCFLGLFAYMCCMTLLLRGRALEIPQCVVAMKGIDNWFDPGSTERGSSLLASVALVYGIVYGGLAVAFLRLLVNGVIVLRSG
jgi:hypothetical protein